MYQEKLKKIKTAIQVHINEVVKQTYDIIRDWRVHNNDGEKKNLDRPFRTETYLLEVKRFK